MFKRVPGTKDILPDQVSGWQSIEKISREIFSVHNYLEIRPPLLEDAALFNRSLGEATEIVAKQMFLVKKESDTYALRPEGTASIVRAYIENNLDKTSGFAKLYYIGPMFRAERPQKARLRQFHHIGCEAIGAGAADIDVEVIVLADTLLQAYGIEGYTIALNSLGCTEDKKKLNKFLKDGLKGKQGSLCDDCKDRYERNILRILDCKNEACQNIVKELRLGDSHLCAECKNHFSAVKNGLDSCKIKYQLDHTLVRGLDYYNRTVFEFKHPDLGIQQDALGAGGRYDGLVKELDGPDVGAIGFALGAERLILVARSQSYNATSKSLVYIISMGEEAKQKTAGLLYELRKAGISSDTDYENKSLKAAMRKANDLLARFVLIIGEDELKEKAVTLKDMGSGTQEKIKREDLISQLKVRI
jgi:histidyl-tRNA synthetase